MTPETATTTDYFWASVRCHALGVSEVDALVLREVGTAFEEDKVVIEAQAKVLARHGDLWSVPLKADVGSIEARRVLDRRIEEEQAGARPALRTITR